MKNKKSQKYPSIKEVISNKKEHKKEVSPDEASNQYKFNKITKMMKKK
jgi:hypothetical protein